MRERTPFPRHLDMPHQLLWWGVDELTVVFVFIAIGVIQGAFITGMALGVAAMVVYRRFRGRNPAGYVLHWAYWHGLVPIKGRNPFQRKVLP